MQPVSRLLRVPPSSKSCVSAWGLCGASTAHSWQYPATLIILALLQLTHHRIREVVMMPADGHPKTQVPVVRAVDLDAALKFSYRHIAIFPSKAAGRLQGDPNLCLGTKMAPSLP